MTEIGGSTVISIVALIVSVAAIASAVSALAVGPSNSFITGQQLIGLDSSPGVISATDSILEAIGKLDGNQKANAPDAITLAGGVTGSGTGTVVATVVTNANLTGEVTSVGNAATLDNEAVIGKVLTGYVSGAGTVSPTDSLLEAIQKLNGNQATATTTLIGGVTGSGVGTLIATVVTNADLTGEATSSGSNAVTLTNSAVISKVLTGYASGAGVVAATDSLLQGIQKLDGNYAATALTGEATGTISGSNIATTLTNSAVISKVLTGYTSGAGVVAATDSLLQGIQKLDGNYAATALTGEATGTISGSSIATTLANSAVISKVLTGYVSGAGTVADTDTILQAIQKLNGNQTVAGTVTLTGGVTGSGVGTLVATVVTNADLTGEATSSGSNAVTLTNSAVIAKVLTGFTSGTGVVAATDSLLQAIQKLDGNYGATALTGGVTGTISGSNIAATVVTNADLTGEATSSGSNAVTLTNSAVISKVLTGYVSGAGTVAATDSILQAIQKLNGNATAPYGSIYTTGDSLPFAIGVARLITMTTTNPGTLLGFTQSGSVLTYTGTATRAFRLSINVTYVAGTPGFAIGFRYSKNGNLVQLSTQNSPTQQFTASNTGVSEYLSIPDHVTLSTGDTITLAGSASNTESIFVAFNLQIDAI